ncbi:Serine-protein kinase RsbW [Alloactinosynnema sp. L-07]|uniref:ATP-binding protein n=1 Tax=Alloactinosynnema sp. L-07 TaxID=1653480 RepID=UPI00065EF6F7|nr:ATP-binding protein [Alloactinosynnema sp. L-07]CRK58451.1 Serine-protein kinase RsbW [Alloactinosynnema sp. L-07]
MSEVETSAPARPNGVRQADVRVSADAEQVPLVRSFAADIAMRLDFDLDAIEDVRMAVDEACSLLVRTAAEGSSLFCSFQPESDSLRVLAQVESAAPVPPSADLMSWQILTTLAESVSEHVETADGGHRVSIELVARPGEAAAR